MTRSRISTNSTSSINNNNNNEGISMNGNTLEFRATLKANKSDNQVQFSFHGGRITARKDGTGMFGEFRPMPYKMDPKTGEPFKNEDGTIKRSSVWTQRVVSNSTPEMEKLGALVQANPELTSVLGYVPPTIEYKAFDWTTFLTTLIGHDMVKFTFSIPQQYISVVESIKDTLESKEDGQNYSIVIRFDANQIRFGVDLKEEYQSELLRKDLKIIPTYIGIIDGHTRTENDTQNLINPVDISSALEKAEQVYENSKSSSKYISAEYLVAQAEKVKARLSTIGTGKKAHQPLVDELFKAAENKDQDKLVETKAVLEALAERGTNKTVTQEYVDKLFDKVENEVEEKPTLLDDTQLDNLLFD